MVISLRGAFSLCESKGGREEEEKEAFGSGALGHWDVMMGWDELGFAGGLPSVLVALLRQSFNPNRGRFAPTVNMKIEGQHVYKENMSTQRDGLYVRGKNVAERTANTVLFPPLW